MNRLALDQAIKNMKHLTNNLTDTCPMLLILLLLSARPLPAQQLTVSNNVLGFACAYGAELYASADLRYWERMRVFTNETALPTNGEARFFRAKSRMRPVQIVAILDTNQIIRGLADKLLTNIVATGEGGTYKGWTEYSRGGTNAFWCFRLPPMPGNTNVTLTLHDSDGFNLLTNIVIDPVTPSTYQFRPPAGARPRPRGNSPPPSAPAGAGIAPSSALDPNSWYIVGHTVSHSYYKRTHNDQFALTTYTGAAAWGAGGADSTADMGYRYSKGYGVDITQVCEAAWTSSTNWFMYQTVDEGPCWFPTTRHYPDSAEIASLDDGQNTWPIGYKSERMTRSASSQASMCVGVGNTASATLKIWFTTYALTNRIGDELLGAVPVSAPVTAGGLGAMGSDGTFTVTVPDGAWLDVTPTITATGSWWTYDINWTRLQ